MLAEMKSPRLHNYSKNEAIH
ncbi:MAG: hypothetical protein JWM65_3541, partial [Sphingomonas bacterium]|nr:hypothetical protein [Sphingomonas bacterium]MDB5676559.1 hypothetical protein [Sphingomonas bacterium]